MKIEFECIVCGHTAQASVSEEDLDRNNRPLETLQDCENCDMETIWIET